MPKQTVIACVCLSLLVPFLFTACNQSKQERMLVEQKLKNLGNDVNMQKNEIAELQMEAEVYNKELEKLRSGLKDTQSAPSADAKQLRTVQSQVVALEATLGQLQTSVASLSAKVVQQEKELAQAKAESKTVKSTTVAQAAKPATKAATPKVAAATPAKKKSTARPGRYYQMKKGETLRDLSTLFKVPETKLRLANGIPPGRNPIEGQSIYVPAVQ